MILACIMNGEVESWFTFINNRTTNSVAEWAMHFSARATFAERHDAIIGHHATFKSLTMNVGWPQ